MRKKFPHQDSSENCSRPHMKKGTPPGEKQDATQMELIEWVQDKAKTDARIRAQRPGNP